MAASRRAVSLSLYRAMLRQAASPAVRHSTFTVPTQALPDDVAALAKRLKPRNEQGLRRLIKEAWQMGAAVSEPSEVSERVDGAFRCLRAMGELHEELEEGIERRIIKADRRGVRYQIGEVLRHRKFGFRAVVIGWDRRPAVDVTDWDGVVGTASGAEQPFYRMLPDMTDCVQHLGGPRDVRYVAEENLEALPVAHRRIAHPGITSSIFTSFDPRSGRFVPAELLAFQYPGSGVEVARRAPPSRAALESAGPLVASLASLTRGLSTFVDAAAEREDAEIARRSVEGEMDEGQASSMAPPSSNPLAAPDEDGHVIKLHPIGSSAQHTHPSKRVGPGRRMLLDLRALSRRAKAASKQARSAVLGALERPLAASGIEQGAAGGLSALMHEDAAAFGAAEGGGGEEGAWQTELDGGARERERGAHQRGDESTDAATSAGLAATYRAIKHVGKVEDYLASNIAERESKRSRREIAFHIGQVLRHRKFGFRAVVFGCARARVALPLSSRAPHAARLRLCPVLAGGRIGRTSTCLTGTVSSAPPREPSSLSTGCYPTRPTATPCSAGLAACAMSRRRTSRRSRSPPRPRSRMSSSRTFSPLSIGARGSSIR